LTAIKQICISFIPPLVVALAFSATAYSKTIGILPIASDFAVFCSALALAIAVIFGAILGRSAVAHTALFAFAIFWLIVGGQIESAESERVKALSWHLLPAAAAIFAVVRERPFWSAQGILRLLCISIALFFIVLFSLSPYAINLVSTLEYGLGDMIFGVPKSAAIIYALAWIVLLARAFSYTRKLVPTALGAACGAFFAGLALSGDRAFLALFFGAGAIMLIMGALPFSFAAIAPKKRRKSDAPPKPKVVALKTLRPLTKAEIVSSFERIGDRIASTMRSTQTRAVLAHPDLQFFNLGDKVNVVLSPAYYWYKRSNAPFKSRRLAKRFAASVFFGWIPEGAYRYFVFKEGDGWGFIACDPSDVTQRLIEQGLDTTQISSVYFAQSALDPIEQPIALSQHTVLSFVNGAWVALPLKFAADAKTFDQTPRVLSAPSFAPPRARSASDIPRKPFWFAASLLVILIATLSIDIIRISRLTGANEADREEILTRAKLPDTQLQLESIERRLTQIAVTQRGLREALNKLFTFAPTARLERLDVEGRAVAARFAPTDTIDAQTIIDRLKAVAPEAEATERDDRVWAALRW
jgi:hypothetical protein